MFKLVSGNIDSTDPSLADRIYSFRHAFFVERMGWEACRKPDHRERDAFDGPDSFHVVGEQHSEIVAYARFLPTIRPHLLTHLYPEILQGAQAPSGPRIYEWTRQAIAPKRQETTQRDAFVKAVSGAIALAVAALDLEGLLIQFHPAMVAWLIETDWDVEPLALPSMYLGESIIPVFARVTEQTLKTARTAFAAWPGSKLDVPEDLGGGPKTRWPERVVQ